MDNLMDDNEEKDKVKSPVENMDDPDFNPLLDSDDDEEEAGRESKNAADHTSLPTSTEIALPMYSISSNKKKPMAKGFGNNPLPPEEVRSRVEDMEDIVNSIKISAPRDSDYPQRLEPATPAAAGDDSVEIDIDDLSDDLETILSVLGEDEGDSLDDLFPTDDENPLRSEEDYSEIWGHDDEEDEDPLDGFNIDELLGEGFIRGASDLSITPRDNPSFSILGKNKRFREHKTVPPEIAQRVMLGIVNNRNQSAFNKDFELDASYTLKTGDFKGRRTRLNVGKSFEEIIMTFRLIRDEIPTIGELGLEQQIVDWTQRESGMVLINGKTGTGKTTIIASLIRNLQETEAEKLVTLEKPIEFVYGQMGDYLIWQREIGDDARSFLSALNSAMRQNPDRIVIGEMRDRLEVDAALFASESGHWTMTSVHAGSASLSISRIKGLFEGPELVRILGSLSEQIIGMVNQILVLAPDGKSRFGIREILEVDDEIRGYIRRGDIENIVKYQMEHKISMDHQFARAVIAGKVDLKEVRKRSLHPATFDKILKEMAG